MLQGVPRQDMLPFLRDGRQFIHLQALSTASVYKGKEFSHAGLPKG